METITGAQMDFYKDKFFVLVDEIHPFLIKDLSSLVRDYCCVQPYVLAREGICFKNLIKPNDPVNTWPKCVFCEKLFIKDCLKIKWFRMRNDVCQHYWFHEACGIAYLGLDQKGLNRKQKLYGWWLQEFEL